MNKIIKRQPLLSAMFFAVLISISASAFGGGYELKKDTQAFLFNAEGLSRLCASAFSERSYLEVFAQKDAIFSKRQLRLAYVFWRQFLKYANALNAIGDKYKAPSLMHRAGYIKNNFDAYTLSIASRVVAANAALNLLAYSKKKPRLHTLLNEPNSEFGFDASSERRLVLRLLRPSVLADIYRFRTSHYEEAVGLSDKLYARGISDEIKNILTINDSFMRKVLSQVLKTPALKFLTRSFATNTVENFNKIKGALLSATDTVYTVGSSKRCIKPNLAAGFVKRLEPGDIVLNRCENNATNIILRGFWIHTMLYIGTIQEASDYFNSDSEVKALCRKYGVNGFAALIGKLYPNVLERWQTADKANGNAARCIIEAMPSGVIISSAELALNADHAAAMRPMLSKLDKVNAILRAFSYFGRTYDICFNFTSEENVVCTELVAKAYTANNPKHGLTFHMRKVYGLLMAIPSNIIAEKFSKEYDTSSQELEFVAFLKGGRKSKTAVYVGLNDFLASYKYDSGFKSTEAK